MSSIGPDVKEALGIRTGRVAGAPIWSCAAIDWSLFNRTIGLGLFELVNARHFQEIGAFGEGNRTAIEASPNALGLGSEALAALGFVVATKRPKLYRTSEPREIPAGVEVRAAGPDDADAFAEVMATSFGFPEIAKMWMSSVVRTRHPGRVTVLALVGGKPAGTGFLYCSEEIGWLGGGCCLPEFRGRGIQRALIEGRAVMAQELGGEWLTAETNAETPDAPSYSFRNMIRSGFKHAFDRPQYLRKD